MKISSFQPVQGASGPMRTTAFKPAAQATGETANASANGMSQDELRYFTTLYPEQSNDISSYSTYSRNGISQENSVGSLIDKKS